MEEQSRCKIRKLNQKRYPLFLFSSGATAGLREQLRSIPCPTLPRRLLPLQPRCPTRCLLTRTPAPQPRGSSEVGICPGKLGLPMEGNFGAAAALSAGWDTAEGQAAAACLRYSSTRRAAAAADSPANRALATCCDSFLETPHVALIKYTRHQTHLDQPFFPHTELVLGLSCYGCVKCT